MSYRGCQIPSHDVCDCWMNKPAEQPLTRPCAPAAWWEPGEANHDNQQLSDEPLTSEANNLASVYSHRDLARMLATAMNENDRLRASHVRKPSNVETSPELYAPIRKPAEQPSEVPAPIPGLPDTMSKAERMRERERISPTPRVDDEVPAPEEVWLAVAEDGRPHGALEDNAWCGYADEAQAKEDITELAEWRGGVKPHRFVRYVRAREGGR